MTNAASLFAEPEPLTDAEIIKARREPFTRDLAEAVYKMARAHQVARSRGRKSRAQVQLEPIALKYGLEIGPESVLETIAGVALLRCCLDPGKLALRTTQEAIAQALGA